MTSLPLSVGLFGDLFSHDTLSRNQLCSTVMVGDRYLLCKQSFICCIEFHSLCQVNEQIQEVDRSLQFSLFLFCSTFYERILLCHAFQHCQEMK